ncbi:hypothetical protein VTK26DRAFT_4647 [Humicola hyalothermophila]
MAAESRSQSSLTSGQSGQGVQTQDRAEPTDVETLTPPQDLPGPSDEDLFKPKSIRFWLTLLCNFLALFLVALDRTIIATAVPRISDEFQALGDIGWYGSSYMLTTACAQLLFGRIYKFYDMKWSFLLSIVVFEIGSAICGAAPSSTVFIIGRAIAGLGSAGIFSGCLLIMIPMIPLHRRPAFQGMFGMVFGIASVMGPLIGGGFTGGVTWRWCFYINLPIGAVALGFMFFFWNPPKVPHEPAPLAVHVRRLDPLGMFFFLPGVVCLFVAFQWGGSTYEWNEWRVLLLLVLAALCSVAFIAVQILKPETATVPPRVITQRSVAYGTAFTFFLAGSMLMLVYYVPVWFQTVKEVDPMKSGIYTLPLVLSLVVSSILSGGITQKIGYYVPSMLASPAIMSIGEGLLSTLKRDSPTSHWVSYQFLSGFGLGFGMQTSGLAIQTVLPREDVSTGIAINFFVQQLGGAVFTSVGQSILTNLLVSRLAGVPGLDSKGIVNEGATNLLEVAPPEYVDNVIEAYNYACRHIFFAAMGLAFASFFCAFGMEWRSIKKGKNGQGPPGPPGPPGAPGLNPASKPIEGPVASGSGTASSDAPSARAAGWPFVEGVKSLTKGRSKRSSTVESKSKKEERKEEKRLSVMEGRKRGVLAKPSPANHGEKSSISAGSSYHSDDKKDEALAGALKDWAVYSRMARLEESQEKRGSSGDRSERNEESEQQSIENEGSQRSEKGEKSQTSENGEKDGKGTKPPLTQSV